MQFGSRGVTPVECFIDADSPVLGREIFYYTLVLVFVLGTWDCL